MKFKDMTTRRILDNLGLLFDDVNDASTVFGEKRITLTKGDRSGKYVKRSITVTIKEESYD